MKNPANPVHPRKATPANTLLRSTLLWVDSLPPEVRPVVLLRDFARIANLIAATWGDLESFESYMASLLSDKRGNRKGFPANVRVELSALGRYRYKALLDSSSWRAVTKRG